jgi:thiol-disulfide isomerase/thioredoxin
MKKLFSLSILLSFFLFSEAQEIPKWKIDKLESFINSTEKPTIVSFWATFCKPCIEEIPYFEKLVKKYEAQDVQLLLVSLDLPDAYPKIKQFAIKRGFTAPIVFLDETNADLFCPKIDQRWSGVIPATLFVNAKAGYKVFFEDQLSESKMEGQIKEMVGK